MEGGTEDRALLSGVEGCPPISYNPPKAEDKGSTEFFQDSHLIIFLCSGDCDENQS